METEAEVILEFGGLNPETEKVFSAFLERYRYSTLGSSVKGVVHNLNGSLQILSMQIELLQREGQREVNKLSPSAHAKMGQCLAQADQLKEMVAGLMRKGIRDEQEEPGPVDLNALLEEELSLLQYNLFCKHSIEVNNSPAPRLPLLKGYGPDFSQGLGNLIQNAIEAMEESPAKKLKIATTVREGKVQVAIGDSGCGIVEKIKPELFKPFCTTKGSRHYGLGLFTARRLLGPYGAAFAYSSRKGETLFTVQFPVPPE
jgi:signal transduction histidine kinase